MARPSPVQLRRAQTRLTQISINKWLAQRVPHIVRDINVSAARRGALYECFAALDADASGAIDFSELAVAMRVRLRERMGCGARKGERTGQG